MGWGARVSGGREECRGRCGVGGDEGREWRGLKRKGKSDNRGKERGV